MLRGDDRSDAAIQNVNMKRKAPLIAPCFLLLVSFCGGCSTLDTHGFFDCDIIHDTTSGLYRGVRQDSSYIIHPKNNSDPEPRKGEPELTFCLGFVDFPFSLTADMVVFPYDLATIKRDESDREVNAIMNR